ncbi:MAG: AMP-binding protein [Limnohabitans sp.]|nr:AMP-binding protein [Limnohabitans sp.]
MNQISYKELHPRFALNDKFYSKDELVQLASDLKNNQKEFQSDLGVFLSQWLDENDFVEVQTSGTTGKPKLIKISKQAMVNSAIATAAFFNLNSGTTALCCLPVKYIAGRMMLVRAMVLGWNLEVVEPKSNPLEPMSKFYDFVAMVPLQVENSIDKLHQIKKLLIGGASISKELASRIIEEQCEAYESYSMTETVTHIALRRIGEKCFETLPNVALALDDRDCLVIDAPFINSEKIITNDLVELISKTQFIWKGRADNVINSGGIKLFPEQIEEKLQPYLNRKFFIAGIEDVLLGQKVVLVIEGEEFVLEETIFSELGKYEKPKEIHFVSKLAETETGKVKRKEIIENIKRKAVD